MSFSVIMPHSTASFLHVACCLQWDGVNALHCRWKSVSRFCICNFCAAARLISLATCQHHPSTHKYKSKANPNLSSPKVISREAHAQPRSQHLRQWHVRVAFLTVPAGSFKVLDQVCLPKADIDANASPSSCSFQQDWIPHLRPAISICAGVHNT